MFDFLRFVYVLRLPFYLFLLVSTMSNIQVIVRCRGRNPQEVASQSNNVVELDNDVCCSPENPYVTVKHDTLLNSKTFKVDQVYGSQASQQLIFKNIGNPLLQDFLNGLNVSILAYGQTGTGKTYTMYGHESNDGLVPLILHDLFDQLLDEYLVKCSFIEIYKEKLVDLLNDEGLKLSILSTNSKIKINNLKQVNLTNVNQSLKLLKNCLSKRQMAATNLNDNSSRSHTIFTIYLYKKINPTQFTHAKFNLVDLAGSENINKSGAKFERAKEAGLINKSLLTLGKIINLLSEHKDLNFIPYRDSKLTHFLQDSLGGNTKTCLIATISPAKINLAETLSTLNYASKAKNIKNLPQLPQDNEVVMKKILINDLSLEINRLSKDLLACKDKEQGIKMSMDNYNDFLNRFSNYENNIKESTSKISFLNSQLSEKDNIIASLRSKLEVMEQNHEISVEGLNQQISQVNEKFNVEKDKITKLIGQNIKNLTGLVNLSLVDEFDVFNQQFEASINEFHDDLMNLINELNIKDLINNNLKLDDFASMISKYNAQMLSTVEDINGLNSNLIKQNNVFLVNKFKSHQSEQNKQIKQRLISQLESLIDSSMKSTPFTLNNESLVSDLCQNSHLIVDNVTKFNDEYTRLESNYQDNITKTSDLIQSKLTKIDLNNKIFKMPSSLNHFNDSLNLHHNYINTLQSDNQAIILSDQYCGPDSTSSQFRELSTLPSKSSAHSIKSPLKEINSLQPPSILPELTTNVPPKSDLSPTKIGLPPIKAVLSPTKSYTSKIPIFHDKENFYKRRKM